KSANEPGLFSTRCRCQCNSPLAFRVKLRWGRTDPMDSTGIANAILSPCSQELRSREFPLRERCANVENRHTNKDMLSSSHSAWRWCKLFSQYDQMSSRAL